ncbi:MAG: HDIG domain-containing protein [Nanoarchaeota archaeon]|nr:HDIG domain-containing protein [Nanoarchaeota archaeon]MBU1703819.1 HDIG domain-containing protein [Nanoarchaeota archaeon]
MNETDAIKLLKKYSKTTQDFEKVLKHSKAVQSLALEICEDIPDVDEDYIRIGSLLHDIGRFECYPDNPDKHGIVGAKILRREGLDEFATIAERHLGAGISKEEIIEQGLDLPLKDYIPITKEEKIITHADNLIKGDKRITLKQAVDRFEKELGKKTGRKIRKLGDEVEAMKKA